LGAAVTAALQQELLPVGTPIAFFRTVIKRPFFSFDIIGFFGSGRCSSRLVQRITQSTSDQQLFIFANPFDRVMSRSSI
jgi:hypothetical protein